MTQPAARSADLYVARHNLQPPVPVDQLIEAEGAEIVDCDWPFNCDAVTSLTAGDPRIYVKTSMSRLRRRFTLGHELGHLVLGWHLNTVMCDAQPEHLDHDPQVLGMDQEAEANLFAARVLVPHRFRLEITSSGHSITETLSQLAVADVSAAAGLISISEYLRPGIILRTTALDRSLFSRNTGSALKELARSEDWSTLQNNARDAGQVRHQNHTVWWYSFWEEEISTDENDGRDTKALFRDVLRSAGYTGKELDRMRMTVSGVIGSAWTDTTLTQPKDLLGVLYQRIELDARFERLSALDDFHILLRRKAKEVAARREVC